jgi:hypothetical protein
MESSIPYAAFRSTNLLPRLVAIAGGQEFLDTQDNARVEVYDSVDAYIVSMKLKFPKRLTGNAEIRAQREIRRAQRNAAKVQRNAAKVQRRAERAAQRPINVPMEPLHEIFTNAQQGHRDIKILNIEPIAA